MTLRGRFALAVGILVAVLAAASPTATAAPRPAVATPVTVPVAATLPDLDGAPEPGPGAITVRPWAPAASAPIRPGVLTVTSGGGTCTSNFVFTAGERTFLGQAAHCAGTGDESEIDGCASGSAPLGTAVTVEAADGSLRDGRLAYSSWLTMQARHEDDADTCAYNDFALVELDPRDVRDVNPSVPYFGGPVGLATDGLARGEQVFGYGNSPARLGIDTLRPKVGISASEVGGGHGHEVFTITPGVPGDSGSAYLDERGDAVGVLSTLNLAPLPVSNTITDLAKALAYANANGDLGDIELVLGTEPFTVSPPGIDAAEVAPPAGPPIGG